MELKKATIGTLKGFLAGSVTWHCALARVCRHTGTSPHEFRIGHVRGERDRPPRPIVLCVKHAEDLHAARGLKTIPLVRAISHEIERKSKRAAESAAAFDKLVANGAEEAPADDA